MKVLSTETPLLLQERSGSISTAASEATSSKSNKSSNNNKSNNNNSNHKRSSSSRPSRSKLSKSSSSSSSKRTKQPTPRNNNHNNNNNNNSTPEKLATTTDTTPTSTPTPTITTATTTPMGNRRALLQRTPSAQALPPRRVVRTVDPPGSTSSTPSTAVVMTRYLHEDDDFSEAHSSKQSSSRHSRTIPLDDWEHLESVEENSTTKKGSTPNNNKNNNNNNSDIYGSALFQSSTSSLSFTTFHSSSSSSFSNSFLTNSSTSLFLHRSNSCSSLRVDSLSLSQHGNNSNNSNNNASSPWQLSSSSLHGHDIIGWNPHARPRKSALKNSSRSSRHKKRASGGSNSTCSTSRHAISRLSLSSTTVKQVTFLTDEFDIPTCRVRQLPDHPEIDQVTASDLWWSDAEMDTRRRVWCNTVQQLRQDAVCQKLVNSVFKKKTRDTQRQALHELRLKFPQATGMETQLCARLQKTTKMHIWVVLDTLRQVQQHGDPQGVNFEENGAKLVREASRRSSRHVRRFARVRCCPTTSNNNNNKKK